MSFPQKSHPLLQLFFKFHFVSFDNENITLVCYRKSMLLKYAETSNVRLVSLAKDIFYTFCLRKFVLVTTWILLLKISKASLFSIHQSHPSAHLPGYNLVVNHHQTLMPICFILCKRHT